MCLRIHFKSGKTADKAPTFRQVFPLVATACFLVSVSPMPVLAQNTPPTGPATQDPLSGPIRKNDVITVQITGEPSLSGQHVVTSEGTITLPLFGAFRVLGKMTGEAAETIATAYKSKNLLLNPQVTVTIFGRPQRKVSIAGALEKQGQIALSDTTHLNEILEPSGILSSSDLSHVVITRKDEKIIVDYLAYRSGNDPTDGKNNPLLEDGDKIYVRARVQIAGMIKINGEVQKPLPIPLTTTMTVGQAIQQAGGVTELADRENVVVRRGGKEIQVPYKAIQEGQTGKDIPLEDKDEIFVRRAGSIKVNGEVRNPQMGILTTRLTVVQAIQLAGGLTDLGDREQVTVMRSGKEIKVPYKAIQEGQIDKDISLQDKDEVFVRRLEKPKVFYVNGGVALRAPSFPIQGAVTLNDAIATAGGVVPGANKKKVTIQRKDSNGQLSTKDYDLTVAADMSTPIQPDDVISVPNPKNNPNFLQTLGQVGSAVSLFYIFRR